LEKEAEERKLFKGMKAERREREKTKERRREGLKRKGKEEEVKRRRLVGIESEKDEDGRKGREEEK
jgi:hypothetical protein